MGLSIVKGYVAAMGGKIWVESELGEGSVFYFTIPYNHETDTQIEGLPEETAIHHIQLSKKLKILIVEDDEPSVILQQELVRKHSKEILYAGNGVDAVETYKMNPDIDLRLMDISLPKMSGYEATRLIREMNKEVINIAQTAHVFDFDRNNAMKTGCNEFITKPLDRLFLQNILLKYFK